MMTRLNAFLMLVLIASALYLVHISYRARQLFIEQERARVSGQKLTQESERLQIERRARLVHERVEQIAQDRLQMRRSTPGVTQYVVDPGAVGRAP